MTEKRQIEIAAEAARFANTHSAHINSAGHSYKDEAYWLTTYEREHKRLTGIQRDIDRAARAKADSEYAAAQGDWPVRRLSFGNRLGFTTRIEYRGFGMGFQRMADGCVSDGGATYREGYWRRRVGRCS